MADEEKKPDTRNRYRDSLVSHQSSVARYDTEMSYDSAGFPANPCSGVYKTIKDGAWKSASADKWLEQLEETGNSIKNAIKSYHTVVNDAVKGEKPEVKVPGPESWKVDWESDRWWQDRNTQNLYNDSPAYGGPS